MLISGKIIIADDQPEVADLLDEMPSMDPYQVIKIHSTTGAKSVIQAEYPDVVLPDVPGMERLLRDP